MLKKHSAEVSIFYLILYMVLRDKKCIGKIVGMKTKMKFCDNYLSDY